MKRIVSLFIVGVWLTVLVGCSAKPKGTAPTTTTIKNTVMIYMVGSDLEAKGASGTNDLQEMMESGVDLSQNNVLVYAGGAKRWHNDHLTAESGHTLLKLTSTGFETVATFAEASMGDASTLSNFLTRVHTDFPAENFSLILWDHGNGPLIGYGKDMLHENDSLTLLEMQEALKKSPFASKKLAWVGFDACLMSSLELSCLWSDYADYLVASQEIEPSFGWNYTFLKELGKQDTKAFLTGITNGYLTTCQNYYTERGYDQRDTTLACIDLTKIGTLKTAVESLAKKAATDINTNYGTLVSQRVKTRALGRATTGSEYDLIDLRDMAEQLLALYPTEAKAVQTALDQSVVANATNTDGCCGLSLYYPFYNKKYYQKTWGDVYSKLGLLPQYTAYLAAYTKQWLGNDMLSTLAQSTLPSISETKSYVLDLTTEQANAYAEASYYILTKEGNGIYNKIFSSKGVTKNGNRLVADFDGQVLYGKNRFDQYFIPATVEHDTVGNQTRYSVYANLINDYATMTDRPDDYEHQVMGHRFHISADKTTKEIRTSALIPYNVNVDTDTLVGGKLQDADLSQWSTFTFLQERHRYLERYENGVIKPVDEWSASSFFSGFQTRVDDGVEFLFAPIPDGEYYLIFEIEDQQGNRYCSELLTITEKGNSLPLEYQPDPIVEVSWASGDEIKLVEKDGVSVFLTTTETYSGIEYALKGVNQTEEDIAILGSDLLFNDSVYCADGSFGYFVVPAGQTAVDDTAFSFGDAANLKITDQLRSLQFIFSIVTARGNKTILYNQCCSVTLSSDTTFPPPLGYFDTDYSTMTKATRGFLANEQLLFEKDGLKGYLMGLGGEGDENGKLVASIRLENTSSQTRYLAVDGFVFDNIYIECASGPLTVPSGATCYNAFVLSADNLDDHQITSPASAKIHVTHMKYATLKGGGGFSEPVFYNITAAKKGSGCSFKEGNTVLYEQNGVRLSLQKAETIYGSVYWYFTLTNKSDHGVTIQLPSVTVNGKTISSDTLFGGFSYRYGACGEGQQTMFILTCDGSSDLTVTFQPQFYDLAEETLLWESRSVIQVNY